LKKHGEGIDWIQLPQDRVWWWALVNITWSTIESDSARCNISTILLLISLDAMDCTSPTKEKSRPMRYVRLKNVVYKIHLLQIGTHLSKSVEALCGYQALCVKH
jgi:hypothetical protein